MFYLLGADAHIYFGVALAGLASFLSPCVLPLVPPYLGYLGGMTLDQLSNESEVDQRTWSRVVGAAIFFVFGFTTVFVGFGAGASTIGQFLLSYRSELGTAAGIIIVLFGLHFLGIMHISLLYSEARYSTKFSEATFGSAYIMGLAFAFGWTPCIGPVLATVLTLAATDAGLSSGIKLLFAYSLGLGLPFILAAIAIQPFLSFLTRFKKYFGVLEKVMGLLLIATGVSFIFGTQNWFSQWLIDNFPELVRIESLVTSPDLGSKILNQVSP